MKTSSRLLHSFLTQAAILPGLIIVLGVGALLNTVAGATEAGDFPITLRASIEQKYTLFGKEAPRDHGRSYALIGFDEAKYSDAPLTRPVDRLALFRNLQRGLAAHGFHEPATGAKPEIVLTVVYGRGWLQNPYLDKTMEAAGGSSASGGAAFGGAPVVTMSADQMLRERQTPGYADKVASANAEKLFISVTAWKFPETPKEKPQQVWRTLMITDDPEGDLNRLSEKMLAAGSAYFDHAIDKEELTVSSKNVEGYVKVGIPTVVGPEKSAK